MGAIGRPALGRSNRQFGRRSKQRSGWVIPAAVFFATACMSALVLAYVFSPRAPGLSEEQPAPTDATRPISVSIGNSRFQIPANFVLHNSARRGGEMPEISLIAMLPNFSGYTLGTAQEFTANAPESRAVHIGVKSGGPVLTERERIDRIYKVQAQNTNGEPGPYGLWQYSFPPESGYHTQDILIGTTDTGPAVLLCTKLTSDVQSPNCLRDTPIGNGLSLSYRFKRAHLAQWRTIDAGVRTLVASFAEQP